MNRSLIVFAAWLAMAYPGAGRLAHATDPPPKPYSGLSASHHLKGQPATNGDMDSPMYIDPYAPSFPKVRTYHPRLKPLWKRALEQADVETRRRTIDTIGIAHERGMPHLADTAVEIVQFLSDTGQDPIIHLAAAQALGRLDARAAADHLLAANQRDGLDMILLTDPILARWDHEGAPPVWMSRLNDPQTVAAALTSAIESLAAVLHAPAAEKLAQMALDEKLDPAMRLLAARAHGMVVRQESEAIAAPLLAGDTIARLVGVSLIEEHDGQRAIELLLGAAEDAEPSVARIALTRLLEIDPLLIKPIGNELVQHRDFEVRYLAARAVAAQKTPESIVVLAPLLNDPNPVLRTYVRRQLIEQDAIAELAPTIREQAMAQLTHDDWRHLKPEVEVADDEEPQQDLQQQETVADRVKSQWRRLEQAAMALGAIDHEPAADMLVNLLDYPRYEVRNASATALRRLQVQATLAPALAYATRATAWCLDPQSTVANDPHLIQGIERAYELDEQVAQLMQLFGIMRYRAAEPLMRQHIPKHSMGADAPRTETRSGAVWALGFLHEDAVDESLAAALTQRMTDLTPMDPERTQVRRASAVSLGRMNATSQLPALRGRYELEFSNAQISGPAAWAIERMTGEELERHGAVYIRDSHFFLTPNDRVESDEYLRERQR